MAKDIVDTWLDESFQQGLQQGLEKGLQQGLQQGLERGLQQGLQQGLEKGLQQGIQTIQIQTIERLLARGGFSLEEIAFLVDGEISLVREVSALWDKIP